ncbi:hypothetical protein HNP84_000203 [Thermocatellispora tengchongensis]|uniref:Uncharacterized protein n=1 Tax=Thermocatellispora tengchongensis TaxID=1073253 RepID=A0A840P393_9ACTN|nr:hypothetical protein [Thermocatellispora tengchongensis]MBB5130515.1 hypothetical protein [Thermocatellispora tengchongensis]
MTQCDCGPEESCPICIPCDICREGEEECPCDGERDWDGSYVCCPGYRIPEHCCDCGGSPYCVKCHKCGAPCFGACTCPVTVRLENGADLVL